MTNSIPPLSRVLVGELYKNNKTGNIYKIRSISFWSKEGITLLAIGTPIVTFSPENSFDCYSTEENEFYSKSNMEGKLQWNWTKVEPTKEVKLFDSSIKPTQKELYGRRHPTTGELYRRKGEGIIYEVKYIFQKQRGIGFGGGRVPQQMVGLKTFKMEGVLCIEMWEFNMKSEYDGILCWDWERVEQCDLEYDGWRIKRDDINSNGW
jgi:hypothetical protein